MAQWLNFGDGHDGSPNAISGTVNTYAACTGTAGQTVLTTALAASEGDQILIHQTQHATAAGTWEVVKVLNDAGSTLNLYTALVNSYTTGAQAILIPQYSSGDISGAVTGAAWDGTVGGIIALMCNGNLTVSGSITAPTGFRGALTRAGDTDDKGYTGEGSLGVQVATNTSSPEYGNAGLVGPRGDANNSAAAGGGGNGEAGGTGTGGGVGGIAVGTAALTTMLFGGGGGGPAVTDPMSGSDNTGVGGNGSGIVLIFAKNITVTGTIPLTGTVGTNPTRDGPGGVGGGAGGSCLIKCQTAVLGTNRITAAGGAGTTNTTRIGGAGGAGRIRCDYLVSVSGSTTPTLSSAQDLTLFVSSGFFEFF